MAALGWFTWPKIRSWDARWRSRCRGSRFSLELRVGARFVREARAASRLDHPNLIPLLEAGSLGPVSYIVSAYVAGPSLDEWLRRNRGGAPPRWAAQIVGALARAMEHAHQRGILHRDLKPANVLLHVPECEGEPANRSAWEAGRLESWTPRICDFGLAKLQEIEAVETRSRMGCGSPPYMAPEQAESRQDDIGPATDVYGLGAILYELLTGRPPFSGASELETLRQVVADEPSEPRKLRPGVPRDLETICLKCLSKRPPSRYGGARALAEDLERFLDGRPIRARPLPPWSLAWRWCRRNAVIATSATMAAIFITGVIWAAVFQWNQASVAAGIARAKVEMLTRAETANVPEMVAQLAPLQHWALPLLNQMARESRAGSKAALHVALALLPDDPSQKEALLGWLAQAETRPEELLVITSALAREGHAKSLAPRLWPELDGVSQFTEGQRRAAGALAAFDPENPHWRDLAGPVAAKLVHENPLLLGRWRDIYRPVARSLSGPLLASYYDRQRREERAVAEGFLLDFAAGLHGSSKPEDYADLIVDADPERFAQILELLTAQTDRRRAIDRLVSCLALPDNGDEALAARQGRAAIALLQLGHAEPVWQMVAGGDHPGACTELIHDLAKFGVDPHAVISRLVVERQAKARQDLVLALGEYAVDRIPASERRALTAKLLNDYRRESDAGLHSSIDWLLRQCWGKDGKLEQIDREVAGREAAEGRDWYVNRTGQTFSVVRGPVEFVMGSPDDEPGRYDDEIRHRVRIERTFAIATREVTCEQYARFIEQSPGVNRFDQPPSVRRSSPTSGFPVVKTDWYDAARYCNWLSRQEGIPQSQWCYPTEIVDGMSLPADWLNRAGYRLPTEAEWEYACRAGSTHSRHEAVPPWLLSKYACDKIGRTSPRRHFEVGRLKPNHLGLFDILGNVWEWVHDPFVVPVAGGVEMAVLDDPPGGPVTNEIERVLRGGASDCVDPQYFRSAMRNRHLPHSRYGSDGFRIARTLKPAPPSLQTD